jgi:hypothetical protein
VFASPFAGGMDIKLPLHHSMVKIEKVNGGTACFIPPQKCAIFCVSTGKSASQNVR